VPPATGSPARRSIPPAGRSRLLMEMVRGEVIRDGWHSAEVRDALDLCLACKGCLKDCPVEVDMATYKAEFLAHHYKGRLRPASHYSMGWLPVAAAARCPGYPAWSTRPAGRPLLSQLIKGGRRYRPAQGTAGLRPGSGSPGGTPGVVPGRRGRMPPPVDGGAPGRRARVPGRHPKESSCGPTRFTNSFHPEVGKAARGGA